MKKTFIVLKLNVRAIKLIYKIFKTNNFFQYLIYLTSLSKLILLII
jgi:hypothetical protein